MVIESRFESMKITRKPIWFFRVSGDCA